MEKKAGRNGEKENLQQKSKEGQGRRNARMEETETGMKKCVERDRKTDRKIISRITLY